MTSSYAPTEIEDDQPAASGGEPAASGGEPVFEDDESVAADVEPATQPPTVTTQPPGTNKRRREEDDTTSTLQEQSDIVVAPQGESTTGTETEPTRVSKSRKKAKKATASQPNTRTSIRRLAQPANANSVSVKTEVSDAKGSNMYFLGPLMTADSVCSYLLLFAANLPKPGPLEMNVAKLPKQALLTRILTDTIRNYARSRTSQNFTDAAFLSSSYQDTVQPVDLDGDVLKEPTHITKTKTLQQSLAMVSDMWKQKRTIGVRQKMLESWAIDIVHNAVGRSAGEKPSRTMQTQIKRTALELMPVLKPAHM